MMYDRIVNFLKDKSLLIAIMVVTFIVLVDNKSYVYIGPDTFRIEKKPRETNQLENNSMDNILSDAATEIDVNTSYQFIQELK